MMPPNVARSGTRGRPPFGFGSSAGKSGSIASQRVSGTSGALITTAHHATRVRFCNTLSVTDALVVPHEWGDGDAVDNH
jgi:hypothetical protein